jgi:hypothetical protein
MHTGPMPESAGTFRAPEPTLYDCPNCGGRKCVMVKVWDSKCGGYEDEKCECTLCSRVWWNEGGDA